MDGENVGDSWMAAVRPLKMGLSENVGLIFPMK